ncbi:MAG TPA: hypothetical protein VH107_13125 [Lacipirellulaceae bacterium]|nr:hypothetical protein [Lacipirellulaceae bacterium]
MHAIFHTLILAAHSSAPNGPEEKGLSLSWAVVLLCVVVGLLVALMPSKRTTEIKKVDE